MRSDKDPTPNFGALVAPLLSHLDNLPVREVLRLLIELLEAIPQLGFREQEDAYVSTAGADVSPPAAHSGRSRKWPDEADRKGETILPVDREASPEEVAALATTREQLRSLGGVLRILVAQLRRMDERLPLPPEPILSLAEESDLGPRLYPTLELSGDLQCFAHDLAYQAWQLERVSLGLPATTRPGEPDPGPDWPPPDFPPDANPEAAVRRALGVYPPLFTGLTGQLRRLEQRLTTGDSAPRVNRATEELLQPAAAPVPPSGDRGPQGVEAITRRQIASAAEHLRSLAQRLRELGAPEIVTSMLAGGNEMAAFLRDGAACGADEVEQSATYLSRLLQGPDPQELREWSTSTKEIERQAITGVAQEGLSHPAARRDEP